MNIRSPAEVRAKQEEAVLARFWIRPRGAVPLIVSEIAERTGVSRQIIGQILVRLTHAGLITATPTSISGKGTSRISVYELTESGKVAAQALREQAA